MLSVATGHSSSYLTDQVGAGMESYYTGAVAAGEPPGQWWGRGAEILGLEGEVDAEIMRALYEQFRDPRDPRFADEATRGESAVLGRAPKQFRSAGQVVEDRIREYATAHASTPTPEQIQGWRLEAERDTPKAVAFYDLTFSPDKSVTVLWASFTRAGHEADQAGDTDAARLWAWRAAQVEEALVAAGEVGLGYVQDNAGYTRVGRHGGKGATGSWEDAHTLTAARFPQHTSRNNDPQLHVHQIVLNKVLSADGVWRALDGKSVIAARPAAGAVSERALEVELTRRLGVQWEPREDGMGRRVVGVDRSIEDLFSSRRQAITGKAAEDLARYEEALGRKANNLERRQILQRATLATRAAKTHDAETWGEMAQRWDAMSQGEVAGGLVRQAKQVVDLTQSPALLPTDAVRTTFSPEAVIAQALEACHSEGGKSTWTRHDLVKHLNDALPDDLGALPEGGVRGLLESLVDQALTGEDAVLVVGREVGTVHAAGRLENGRSKHLDPAAVQYATRGHLAAEDALLRSCGVRGRTAIPAHAVTTWLDTFGASLNPAQRQAVLGIASSDAALVTLVGPAGTGKSYVAGLLDAAWRELTASPQPPGGAGEPDPDGGNRGRVVGVATTQVAADILREDGVADTANVAAFLAAQRRLASGTMLPDDAALRLTSNDLLVVDEASMVDTYALTRLQAAVDAAGARMVLMGDPHQLGAVGAGGMMRAAIDRDAETYTLSDVRRFSAEWEREASLRLRDGDSSDIPAAVGEYDARGRLLDAGTADDAVAAVARAAAADRLAGKDVVVVAASNEHAAAVSSSVRALLVEAGVVQEAGVVLGRDETPAGVGDLVQARRIDRTLGLVNREVYEVTAIQPDGALDVVCRRTGEVHVMPAGYVAQDVALAYASTAHGAQGRTADVGHLLLTQGMDRAGAYVGLTRGRESNTAWAVTESLNPDQPSLTARGILARSLTTWDDPHNHPAAGNDLAAVDIADAAEAHRTNAGTLLALVEEEIRVACRERLDRDLDTLTADGLITDEDRARLGADQGTEHLSRLLRSYEQAGHEPLEVLRDAVTSGRSLTDAVSVAQVLATRIHRSSGIDLPAPALEDANAPEAASRTPGLTVAPQRIDTARAGYVDQLLGLLDERRHNLGQALADHPADERPTWLTATLGPLPDDVDAYASNRQQWIDRAGAVAALREATGWDHEEIALGRCPGVSSPEKRAAWHAAYAAAGMPEERRPEAELTDGRLLVRARAAELARAGAPDPVYDAQRERHRLAELAAREAVLARSTGREDDAARYEADAERHRLLADHLDAAADARARWLVDNAETLSAGDSAAAELTRRGIAPGAEPDRVTPAEWLAAEAEARAADDAHRPITEADLVDQDRDMAAHEEVDQVTSQDARNDAPSMQSAPRAETTAAEDAATTDPFSRSLRGGFTKSELALIHATAARHGAAVQVCSFIVPDDTFASTDAGQRPEVTRILTMLERQDSDAVRSAEAARPVTGLSADATAAEIAAVAARARAAFEVTADHASQERAQAASSDDEWQYLRTRGTDDSADLGAVYDSTPDRDAAFERAWDDAPAVGDTLAAGND
ncbi:MobF family relaxase [Kineosporia sp. R_H_3]|uniref:MobF family relaxase n=1 Tax=Kineosporia sp. R_H_3 TaxID=1961848 RepID=UPI0013046E65|nr:MobF family relaxase [Kineosporia sp. R_H_3]